MRLCSPGAPRALVAVELLVLRVTVASVLIALSVAGCTVEAAPQGLGARSIHSEPLAEPTRARADGVIGVVTAESTHGHGTVSGAVRRGRAGLEVRMPGGTWIGCGRSCADTLRRETVDFWESRTGPTGNGGEGRGYVRWRW
jgi:hypothetical protein